MLLLSGIPLELIHDGANVSLIFMAGTVIGAFLSYATETTLLVGASAGVYAMFFSHICNTVVNGDLMSPKSLLITLILNLPLLALFLYDVISLSVGKASNQGRACKISQRGGDGQLPNSRLKWQNTKKPQNFKVVTILSHFQREKAFTPLHPTLVLPLILAE